MALSLLMLVAVESDSEEVLAEVDDEAGMIEGGAWAGATEPAANCEKMSWKEGFCEVVQRDVI